MEHVVFFPSPDGTPAFRRVSALEEAVRLVEHLRNVEGVGEVSVHALSEVPLSFRAYYRVELPTAVEPAHVAAPVAEQVPFVEQVPAVEHAPVVEQDPAVEHAPVVEQDPAVEPAPVVQTPAVERVLEPVVAFVPVGELVAPVAEAPVEAPTLELVPAVAVHEMPPLDLPLQEVPSETVVPEPAHAHGRRSLGFFSS